MRESMKAVLYCILALLGITAQGQIVLSGTTSTTSTFTCYHRYSGFCQPSPLSTDDLKLDAAYAEIDKTLSALGKQRMSFITINEYLTVVHTSDRLPWYRDADSVYSAERELKAIFAKVEERSSEELKTNVQP
jgi:hypothetical protein